MSITYIEVSFEYYNDLLNLRIYIGSIRRFGLAKRRYTNKQQESYYYFFHVTSWQDSKIPLTGNSVFRGGGLSLSITGVSPDEKKEDNIYTGISSLDLEALRKSQAQLMGKGNEVQMTMFRGRMVTGSERISAIDLNTLLKGGIVHLHFPLFPPSAALVDSLKANSVFVTAPSVVEDPLRTYDPCSNVGMKMGPWTFGFLMTQLANSSATGVSPSRFVLNWLLSYTHTQTVNGDPMSVRPNINAFIHHWLVQSNGLAAASSLRGSTRIAPQCHSMSSLNMGSTRQVARR